MRDFLGQRNAKTQPRPRPSDSAPDFWRGVQITLQNIGQVAKFLDVALELLKTLV
jgi:hypothetical protein